MTERGAGRGKTREQADGEAASAADAIHGAAIRLLRFVRREDAAAGLSAPQLSALSVLVFGGPQTMGALAAAEQVQAPTMSRTVGDLERQGLVERATRTADRRTTEVRVTPAGRALLEAGRRRRLARLVKALGGASQAELRSLAEAARILVRVTDTTLGKG
jgi:DNA-binding MarR family transcriptional regulator